MKEIVLQIPTLDAEQNVEIDVKINGKKRTLKYRVEIVDWQDAGDNTEEKITVLKTAIKEHSEGWDLVQIGAPSKNTIPIMFRKKMKEEKAG